MSAPDLHRCTDCLGYIVVLTLAGLQVDLQQLLPEYSFVMISSEYAEQNMLSADHMRKLLLHLGAADHIAVPEQTRTLTPSDQAQSPWADISLGEAPESGWTIRDNSSAEFEAVLQSILSEAETDAQMLSSLRNLVGVVSSRWEAHYSHCLTATCLLQSGASHYCGCSHPCPCLSMPVLHRRRTDALRNTACTRLVLLSAVSI